ncbi:hypothetical protein FOMA001_g8804 [Fusarium oxysporum f. sp. matthiolae]|nr:hypothetical protein FOMA001_g8804 [Fusarium oxysporum f. sp. matthiolae]
MRLINTKTLELHEFFNDNVPPYAILSHTWGTEEVTFQDWQSHQVAVSKQGYLKIKNACRKSLNKRLEWLWVDTNCIDKTSSAELTEAINSMFAYYQKSQVCFAYLADVTTYYQKSELMFLQVRGSRWFTRGWTLQELIAPRHMVFYAADWSKIGTKDEFFARLVASITKIDSIYLSGQFLPMASVSQKMSWLANRTTTRTEDMAYCMLGIFDHSMPLLYGEGKRAFFRLQEEIIKRSNDHTIFCWEWIDDVPGDWGSLLAPWPTAFEGSGGFEKLSSDDISIFSMTNAGLSIPLPTITSLGGTSYHTSSWFVMLQARLANTTGHPPDAACIQVSGRQVGDLLYVARLPYPARPTTIPRTLVGHLRTQPLIVMNRLEETRLLKERWLFPDYHNRNNFIFIPVCCPQTPERRWRFAESSFGPVLLLLEKDNFGVSRLMFKGSRKDEEILHVFLGVRIKDGHCYAFVKIVPVYSKTIWHHWKQYVERSTSDKQEADFCGSLGVTVALRRSIDNTRGGENRYFLFFKEGGFADSENFLSTMGFDRQGNDTDSIDVVSDVAEISAFEYIDQA